MTAYRDRSIDTLRGLAVTMVVVLHVTAPYVTNGYEQFGELQWTPNLLNSFSRIAVPLFIMITGKYLLGNTESTELFFRKRFDRVAYPLIFWTVIYSLYTFLGYKILKDEWNYSAILTNLINGVPHYHLWYLYMLIGLYLITPLLRNFLPHLTNRQTTTFGFVLIFIGIIIDIWDRLHHNNQFFILWFIPFLGYYVLGNGLSNRSPVNPGVLISIYLISSLAIAVLTHFTISFFGGSPYFYSYLSPFVISATLVVFSLFNRLTVGENFFSKISTYSLGIYIIHAGILDFYNLIVFPEGITGSINFDIPILVVIVFFPAFGASYFMTKVPGLRRMI